MFKGLVHAKMNISQTHPQDIDFLLSDESNLSNIQNFPGSSKLRSIALSGCFCYWYFSYKNTWIRNRRPLFNPHMKTRAKKKSFFYGFAHFILLVLDCVTETPADSNDRA